LFLFLLFSLSLFSFQSLFINLTNPVENRAPEYDEGRRGGYLEYARANGLSPLPWRKIMRRARGASLPPDEDHVQYLVTGYLTSGGRDSETHRSVYEAAARAAAAAGGRAESLCGVFLSSKENAGAGPGLRKTRMFVWTYGDGLMGPMPFDPCG
jgi:hypothetical protein